MVVVENPPTVDEEGKMVRPTHLLQHAQSPHPQADQQHGSWHIGGEVMHTQLTVRARLKNLGIW